MRKNRAVFIDANVFIALYNKSDSLHKRAVELWRVLKEAHARLATSDMVLSEVLTVLRLRVGKTHAETFGDIVFTQSQFLTVLYVDKELLRRSYRIFKEIRKKDISFVDCSILAMAKEYSLKIASFDTTLLNFVS